MTKPATIRWKITPSKKWSLARKTKLLTRDRRGIGEQDPPSSSPCSWRSWRCTSSPYQSSSAAPPCICHCGWRHPPYWPPSLPPVRCGAAGDATWPPSRQCCRAARHCGRDCLRGRSQAARHLRCQRRDGRGDALRRLGRAAPAARRQRHRCERRRTECQRPPPRYPGIVARFNHTHAVIPLFLQQ